MSGVRSEGQVKWFNEKKGFGFIVDEEGNELFVHYKEIRGDGFRTLEEKQKVTYLVEAGPKGLKAQDVMVEEMA
jgi:cold shock protein